MIESEATQLVGLLVAGTSGWDDHQAQLWVAEMGRLDDIPAAHDAVMGLIRTWTKPGHPPIAELLAAYRRELARRPPPPKLDIVPTPRERAMRLAWDGYCAEARRLGKEPDRAHFLATMGGIK